MTSVDQGQTAQAGLEGAVPAVEGGAVGRQDDRVGRAVARTGTGGLGILLLKVLWKTPLKKPQKELELQG